MLRRGFTGKVGAPERAFECPRCEAVIYQDEFTLGKFLPPQFKEQGEGRLVAIGSGPGDLSANVDPRVFGGNEVASR
jgi:hypothetical protein